MNRISVVKFLPDGNIDYSFAESGIAEISLGDGDEFANAILCLPDKDILIAGSSVNGAFLARYDLNGDPDLTFGTNGIIMTDFGTNENENYAITIQSDGKIVVAGVSGTNAQNANGNYGLVRYNSNGTIDETFGINGKITLDLSNGYNDVAFAVKVQSDGKLVAAGISHNGSYYNISLARFNSEITDIEKITKNNSICVYPNPVTNLANITYPKNIDFSLQNLKVEIINDKSQIVKTFYIYDNSSSINLHDLIPGTYIMRLYVDDEIFNSKFIFTEF
jgi:uncharacterized delta-60 repeat protein